MTTWGYKDGAFDLRHFYHIIVDTLSVSGSKWVKETMDWWQRSLRFTFSISDQFNPENHNFLRKLFGDSSADSTEDVDYQLTTQTAYMMMRMQDDEVADNEDKEEVSVKTRTPHADR